MKTGILLINTGTPDAPEVAAIQRYLREFLMDPYIRPLPSLLWKPILSLFILPARPKHTVASYKKIWADDGSPFMLTSMSQRDKVYAELKKRQFCDGEFQVETAMRYGNPSIKSALESLSACGCERIVAFPLYPQQVKVCAGTCLKKVRDCLAEFVQEGWNPQLVEIPYYYDLPAYVEALAESVRKDWAGVGSGKLLLSFHSTLMADINAGDPYKQQAEATATALTNCLGLSDEDFAVAYQSRFDNRKWLQPSVRELLLKWADEGVDDVCVLCPGFSVDCLESLIEIAQNARDIFLAAAGEGARFTYVPALNDCDAVIDCFVDAIFAACE